MPFFPVENRLGCVMQNSSIPDLHGPVAMHVLPKAVLSAVCSRMLRCKCIMRHACMVHLLFAFNMFDIKAVVVSCRLTVCLLRCAALHLQHPGVLGAGHCRAVHGRLVHLAAGLLWPVVPMASHT